MHEKAPPSFVNLKFVGKGRVVILEERFVGHAYIPLN
jgi:hypothetical protein